MPNNILDEDISPEGPKKVVNFEQVKTWLLVLFFIGTTFGLGLSVFYLKPMLIEANVDATQTVQDQLFFFGVLINLTYLSICIMIAYLWLNYYFKIPEPTGFNPTSGLIINVFFLSLLVWGCSITLGLLMTIALAWLPQWLLEILPEIVFCIISSLFFYILYRICLINLKKSTSSTVH